MTDQQNMTGDKATQHPAVLTIYRIDHLTFADLRVSEALHVWLPRIVPPFCLERSNTREECMLDE